MLSSQTIFVLQGHVEMQEKCDNLTITSTYPEVFFYSISVSTFIAITWHRASSLNFYILMYFSQTTGPFGTKLGRNPDGHHRST
jgi:hypothetical protein